MSDLRLLVTSARMSDLTLMVTSARVSDLRLLGTSARVSDLRLLVTSARVSDLTLMVTSARVSDLRLLGTSARVSNLRLLVTSAPGTRWWPHNTDQYCLKKHYKTYWRFYPAISCKNMQNTQLKIVHNSYYCFWFKILISVKA